MFAQVQQAVALPIERIDLKMLQLLINFYLGVCSLVSNLRSRVLSKIGSLDLFIGFITMCTVFSGFKSMKA